jgi:hypothetical protein
MPTHVPAVSVAEQMVDCILALDPARVPALLRARCPTALAEASRLAKQAPGKVASYRYEIFAPDFRTDEAFGLARTASILST